MSLLEEEYITTAEQIKLDGLLPLLENKTILLTGSTGLIATQIGRTLLECNHLYNSNIHLVLHARNKDKLVAKYGTFLSDSHVSYILNDIKDMIKCDLPIDFIIHTASITSSLDFINYPVETIDTLINGTKKVLEFARAHKVKKVIYLSSLEVYGDIHDERELIDENKYGYIDFLKERSSYSEGKRMSECLCSSFAKEYDLFINIARLSQTIGSDISLNDNRVFAQFGKFAVLNKDIVLKTKGNTIRSYTYISDAVRGILFVLLKGENRNAYNIANKNTLCSISELAHLFAKKSEYDIKVIYDLSENASTLGYNNEIKINLDTTKIEKLGFTPSVGLEDIVNKLIQGLKEKINQ